MTRNTISILMMFILSTILLFTFLSSPLENTKNASLFNLLLLGSLGSLVFFEVRKSGTIFFNIRDTQDLINDTAVGTIAGVVAIAVIVIALSAHSAVYNLFGTITAGSIQQLAIEDQLFIQFIQPITETILLVGLFRVMQEISKNNLVAFAVTALSFTLFHFNALGKDNFAYSANGFISFLTSSTGAFNSLILGLVLIASAIAFRSWIVAFIAHVIYNTYTVAILWTGFFNPLVLVTFLFLGGIVFITYKKNGLRELNTFNWKYLVSPHG